MEETATKTATKMEKNPIVKEMEEKYPEMTKEFKKILNEEYELFCKKQKNYGTVSGGGFGANWLQVSVASTSRLDRPQR